MSKEQSDRTSHERRGSGSAIVPRIWSNVSAFQVTNKFKYCCIMITLSLFWIACAGALPGVLPGAVGEIPGYIDVTDFSASLDGDLLTAIFKLRDLPESITINRAGVETNELEYEWTANVFLDGKRDEYPDYALGAMHFVDPSDPFTVTGRLEDLMQVNVWQLTADSFELIADAQIEVDYAAKTITLVGEIPGINEQSLVVYSVFDYLFGRIDQQTQ